MRRYIELVRPLATEAQLRETQRLAKVLHWSRALLHCECLKPPVTATERRRSRARGFGGRNSRVASALNSTYPQHASRSTREHARRRGADVAVPVFQAELLRRESDFAKAAPAQGTPPPTRPPAHPDLSPGLRALACCFSVNAQAQGYVSIQRSEMRCRRRQHQQLHQALLGHDVPRRKARPTFRISLRNMSACDTNALPLLPGHTGTPSR